MWRQSWIMLRKELVTASRDKRTRFMVLIMPLILVPILTILVMRSPSVQVRALEQATLVVGFSSGKGPLSELIEQVLAQSEVTVIPSSSPEADVKDGTADIGVTIVETEQPPVVRLVVKSSDRESLVAQERVKAIVQATATQLVADQFALAGLDMQLARPFNVEATDLTAGQGLVVTAVGSILLMLVITWPGVGSMQMATDVGAGEKERGTLEPLLTTPVDVRSVVTGKFVAVFLHALVVGSVAIIAGFASIVIAGKRMGLAEEIVTVPMLMQILLVLSLVALFTSAVGVLISMMARSTKEAGVYLAPFNLLLFIPILLSEGYSFTEIPLSAYLVPVLNYLLLVKGVFAGNAIGVQTLVSSCSLVFFVLLLWTFAARILSRESAFRGF